MNEFKLFKECVISAGQGKLRIGSFSRYIFILNNYKKRKTLSEVEPKNHQNFEPKSFFLKFLAEGFNLTIDLDSPLFEGRLNKTKDRCYHDSFWFFERFFERISLMREAELNISVSDLSMGSLYFIESYGDYCIESRVPYIDVHGKGCSTEKFTVRKYRKSISLNLVDFLLKQDPSDYSFNNQLRERAISRLYEDGDKEVKEKALNALVSISKSYKSAYLDRFFKKVYEQGMKDGDLLSIIKS